VGFWLSAYGDSSRERLVILEITIVQTNLARVPSLYGHDEVFTVPSSFAIS
jgi:hypothetical protein